MLFGFAMICLALGIIILYSTYKVDEAKKESVESAIRSLDTLYNESAAKLESEARELLNDPKYAKSADSVVITTGRISLYYGNMNINIKCDQEYDFWRNKDYLVCMSNIEGLKKRLKSAQTSAGSFYKNFDMRWQDMKKSVSLDENKIHSFSIPIEKIEYFSMGGNKYTTTEVTGGGGTSGGSSVKGAIIGGLVAGEVGAVIGSRKETKIEPVKTYTRVHDETESFLKYTAEDGSLAEVFSRSDVFYKTLKQIIPEKEYAYIIAKRQESVPNTAEQISIEERLVQLKDLLEKELISQEEYDSKRKAILEKM